MEELCRVYHNKASVCEDVRLAMIWILVLIHLKDFNKIKTGKEYKV